MWFVVFFATSGSCAFDHLYLSIVKTEVNEKSSNVCMCWQKKRNVQCVWWPSLQQSINSTQQCILEVFQSLFYLRGFRSPKPMTLPVLARARPILWSCSFSKSSIFYICFPWNERKNMGELTTDKRLRCYRQHAKNNIGKYRGVRPWKPKVPCNTTTDKATLRQEARLVQKSKKSPWWLFTFWFKVCSDLLS